MKHLSLTKAFFISAVFTVSSLGIGACSTNQAKKDNPDFEKKIAYSIDSHFISDVSFDHAKNWKLATNSWQFPTDHKVEVKIVSEDIRVKVGTVNEIKIEAKGQVKHDKSTLMTLETQDKKVVLTQKNDDEVHRVSVTIWLPENSQADLDLKTVSGEVDIENIKLYELTATTVSGDIKAHALTLEKLQLKSVSGDIEVNDSTVNSADAFSISGDVKMKLQNSNQLKYELHSLSGDIEKSVQDSNLANATLVRIQTTSGDIEVQ